VTPFVFSMVLTFFQLFAPFFHFIRDTKNRHFFAASLGFIGLILEYGESAIHPIAMVIYCYLIMRYVPVRSSPHVFLAVAMAHQTYGHIYRAMFDYLSYSMEWTLSTMLLTLKLAGAVWSRRDGYVQKEAQEKGENVKFTRLQQEAAICRDFSLLELFSFGFFFPGVFVGPFHDIKQYLDFIEFNGRYADLTAPKGEKPRVTLGRIVKSPQFWTRPLFSVFYILIYFVGEWYFYDRNMCKEEFHENYNFIQRILYLIVSVEMGNCKYYFTWTIGEIGTILSGLGYAGENPDGSLQLDACIQIDIIKFKMTSDPKDLTKYWSMSPQHYLKKDVFERLKPHMNYIIASLITFTFSAAWHGIYPGYFIFFLSAAIFSLPVTKVKSQLSPFIYNQDGTPKNKRNAIIFEGFFIFTTQFILDFVIVPFRVMSFKNSYLAWKNLDFVGVIFVLLFLVASFFLPPPPKREKPAPVTPKNE